MNSVLSSLDDDGLGRRLRGLGGLGGPLGPLDARDGPALIEGAVVLDSALGGLAAVRSAGVLEQRQVVAQAENSTVVLDLAPLDPGWKVSGQLFGLDLPAAVQFLDASGAELTLVVSDELGEFEAEIPDGDVHVVVATRHAEVVIDLTASA